MENCNKIKRYLDTRNSLRTYREKTKEGMFEDFVFHFSVRKQETSRKVPLLWETQLQ